MTKFTLYCASALAAAALSFTAHGQNAVLSGSALAPDNAARVEQPQVLNAVVTPAEAATYYDDSHKDLKQVLSWIQETNAMSPQAWSVYTEARIRLKMKDYQGARAAAEQSKKLALAASPPSSDYAQLSEEVVVQAAAMQLMSRKSRSSEQVLAQTQSPAK